MNNVLGVNWYRVILENSYYEDMLGVEIKSTEKSITLYFPPNIGEVTFYKGQVLFDGRY